MTNPIPRELMKRMEREHFEWAKRMAKENLNRVPSDVELRSLGRVPWHAGAQALWSALMERPPIEEAAQGAVIVVLDIQNANLRAALVHAQCAIKDLGASVNEMYPSDLDGWADVLLAEIEKLERGGE